MFLMSFTPLYAQYFSWGASPSSIKWNQLKSDSIKLIYPTYWQYGARQSMQLFDTLRPSISYGFSRGPARTPVIMHTQNMQSNGVVSYTPKRIELITFPGIDGFAEPWLKQLIAHEYRHSVQFNNLHRSTVKALSILLGDQGFWIGSLVLPSWYMEGDAVMAETQMTTYGRALQPSFTMEYRALGRLNPRKWQIDRWFSGSYKHNVPDHYHLGYQMTRWMYENLGQDIWDRITRYSSDYPFFIFPRAIYLSRHYKLSGNDIFRRTFDELADYWESLPKVEDSSKKLPIPIKSYTTFSHPLWKNDSTIITLKEDFDNIQRLVEVDAESGKERLLCRVGRVSSRPSLGDNRIYWTEYRNSTVWAERVNSALCYYDFAERRKHYAVSKYQVFLPTVVDDGALCYVTYDYTGRFAIRCGFSLERNSYEFADGVEIRALAWDNATKRLYFIALDQRGEWIGALKSDWSGYEQITEPRFITISDLRAADGQLYFGSIVSGKDEAHSIDLATGIEYRITESNYGSFQPSPDASGRRAVVTTYDSMGYKLALQDLSTRTVQPYRKLPVNLVNPPTTKWDVINLDSVQLSLQTDSLLQNVKPAKRYRKALHGFNLHSWAPFEMNPMTLLDDLTNLDWHVGATIMSQNLLSSMTCYASYGWSRTMGSRYRLGFDYTGWGPTISFSGAYGGGSQMVYNRPAYVAMPKLRSSLNFSLNVSQPLWLSSGAHLRRLTPSIGVAYTNDIFYDDATPRTGLLRMVGSLNYSEQRRMAHRDFAPRWGYNLNVSVVANPNNRNFNSTLLFYAKGYLPGVAPHHTTQIQANYQRSIGNKSVAYRVRQLFPRGAEFNFTPRKYIATSLDYELPVAYPDWGIPSILFIRRIRVGAFVDYAQYQPFESLSSSWNRLYSYGAKVTFDVVPISLPPSANTSITVTVAKPSDRRGVVVFASIGVPL